MKIYYGEDALIAISQTLLLSENIRAIKHVVVH